MKKVLIAILLVGAYLVFGVYPSYQVNGNIVQLTITRETPGDTTHIVKIDSKEDIKKLIEPVEMLWSSFGSINSWEEYPRYRVLFVYEDGTSDLYIFSENEWSGGAKTPIGYIELVEGYIHNNAIKKDAAK